MSDLKPGWRNVRFGDAVTSMGATRKARGWNPRDAGLDRYVGLEHLDSNSPTIRRWGDPNDVGTNSDLRLFEPGDVILARRGIEQRKVGLATFAGVASGHALVFRARPDVVLPEFLAHFLLSDAFMGRAHQFSAGSLSKTVNLTTLLRLEFALPSLQEQHRIAQVLVAALNAQEAARVLTDTSRRIFESFSVATLEAACAGAETADLNRLCLRTPQSGIYKPADFLGRGAPMVQMGELFANDTIRSTLCATRIEINDDELERFQLDDGDLLFGRRSVVLSGAGRCVLVEGVSEPTVFESSILRIRVDGARILPRFAFEWFRSPTGARAIGRIVTFTTVAGIKGSDLARLRVPVPRIEAQRAACAAIAGLRVRLEHTHARYVESQTMVSNLQHLALDVQ